MKYLEHVQELFSQRGKGARRKTLKTVAKWSLWLFFFCSNYLWPLSYSLIPVISRKKGVKCNNISHNEYLLEICSINVIFYVFDIECFFPVTYCGELTYCEGKKNQIFCFLIFRGNIKLK
jgi:hypothetical protein